MALAFLLSLRSTLSISSISSLIFLAWSSARSLFSRSAADSFGGGRRAAAIGSEGERLLLVELMGNECGRGIRGALVGGRNDWNVGDAVEVSK